MQIADLLHKAEECLSKDNYDEAIALCEQCIEADANLISGYWKLGLALLLAGREDEAQACWLSALLEGVEDRSLELVDLLETEGIQRLEAGKYEQAEKIYWQIIEQVPDRAVAYKNLGNALFNQGKVEEAISCYLQGIELEGNDATAYYNLGNAFYRLGSLKQAINCYQQSLSLDPNSSTVLNNLGNAWQRQGNFQEAIVCYQQSLKLDNNNALTYNNLGSVFNIQGKLEEALNCFEQGLILEPNNVEAYNNLAVFYQEQREYKKALEYCDKAIDIDPSYAEAHFTRAINLLRLGDYKRGFIEYEWRWRRKEHPPRILPKPVWDGSNIAGKTILLQAEQGMGDMIQFIRYVPELIKLGVEIIVECHPPLVKLLKTIEGIKRVLLIGETLAEFDTYIPIVSLPYILGTTLETVPAQIPYLAPLETISFPLELIDKSYLKVGIVWAGNPTHSYDHKRSSSLKYFQTIFNTPNITFYSLQKGPKSAEIFEQNSLVNLIDLSGQINDFADTAAVVNQLDLVITVDTAVAHLAGALGKPVWVILCYNADWRWMSDREDTPWYPTMRLFRQNTSGDWQEVLERVAEALRKFKG